MTKKKSTKKSPKIGRPSKANNQSNILKSLDIFTLRDAIQKGVPAQSLARLVKKGIILRLERNLYRHSDLKINPGAEDYAVACMRFGPKSVIGGLTALFHYQLIDESPSEIWVLVPPEKITRMNRYRIIRTKTNLDVGIDDKDNYRIVTVERSIVEAFKYSGRLGLETALHAARLAIKTKLTTASKLLKTARMLQLESCVMKHWEAITAE